MLERFMITVLLGAIAVIAYWMLNRYQKRHAATSTPNVARPGQARLLYFRSEHCSTCAAQTHYLSQLEAGYRALVQPIDVERETHLAEQYNILALPTTILVDATGNVRHLNPGLTNSIKLRRQLEDLQHN